MALIAGSLPPQTCYGTPQQMLDLFAQYLSTPSQNIILESGSTSFPATALTAFSSSDRFVDVAGASIGDAVVFAPTSAYPGNTVAFFAWVSSPNSVQVRIQNVSSNSFTSTAFTYRVKVLKF